MKLLVLAVSMLMPSRLGQRPPAATAEGSKLRVFILAGQSNRQGYAEIRTFDGIGEDPATAPFIEGSES